MEKDYQNIIKRIEFLDKDVADQAHKKEDAEKLRTTLLEKLELNRQTLEERERDVQSVKAKLGNALIWDFLLDALTHAVLVWHCLDR